MGILMKNKK